MVDTYAKCGLFEEAEAVVDMLPDPSIIFQTALMAGQLEQWHPVDMLPDPSIIF